MKTSKTKTIKTRTWYGMEATVTIGPLRLGLTENARSSLSFIHEIGHLESGPLAVFYAAVNLAVIYSTGQANLQKIIFVFISAHAAWEIISEIFTITRSGDLYLKHYEGVTIIPRTIFWTFAIVLTLVGWIIALPYVQIFIF
jgi:hypothetical protein